MGEDLLRGLLSVCKSQNVRCGLIRATGVLKKLAVQHYDSATKALGKPALLEGPLTLLSATGALSELGGKLELSLKVTASRQGDNGVEVVGGTCESATVLACDFVVEALDDLLLRRSADPRTGLVVWTDAISAHTAVAAPEPMESEPALPRPATTEPAPDPTPFEQKAVISAPEEPTPPGPDELSPPSMEPDPEDEEQQQEAWKETYRPVENGDVIMHAQFGECEVQRVSAGQEYATVRRLANKRLVRLSLEVLDLHFLEEQDGHKVFETKPAKR